jgi:hypothetical protein
MGQEGLVHLNLGKRGRILGVIITDAGLAAVKLAESWKR